MESVRSALSLNSIMTDFKICVDDERKHTCCFEPFSSLSSKECVTYYWEVMRNSTYTGSSRKCVFLVRGFCHETNKTE